MRIFARRQAKQAPGAGASASAAQVHPAPRRQGAAPGLVLALAATLCVPAGATRAQDAAPRPSAPEAPTLATPPPPAAAGSLTDAPARGPEAKRARLSLSASLSSSPGRPLTSGLVWRIYGDMDGAAGEISRPVVETGEATPVLGLKPGVYIVHATYGFASAMRRIDLTGDASVQLSINAGGLKVLGVVGDVPVPAAQMRVSVYVPAGQDLEGRRVLEDAPPGEVIRLPEGVYHVVSTYGDSNAVMRADLRVEPGKVTEATLRHRAATVTLKLVQSPGGEAFAGTAFSVLTPGGDVIREEIGAFPSLVLAEGDYIVIARHDGKVHTREFRVESGVNRDVEVLASN